MNRTDATRLLVVFSAILLVAPLPASEVTIPTVPVGNPGNAADVTGFGTVNRAYQIATTEVTNGQYTAFLNAKAASDPLGLYNSFMGSEPRGGILQSGVSPNFSYTTKPFMGNKPVNFVSWYDAIRFANWLHNGQGNGDTESGSYTLVGGTATPSNFLSIARSAGATWVLPNQNEWYKAAYHQPAADGGDADDYWGIPTRSNAVPALAIADAEGNITNNLGSNVANYLSGADWNGQDGNVTTVGDAGPLSESFYGTSDQGGNVNEWTQSQAFGPGVRVLRGGSYFNSSQELKAGTISGNAGFIEQDHLGFRLALVPEPSTAVLAILGMVCLILVARRKR